MIPSESPAQRFTRRELLRRGAMAAAAVGVSPAILAACGSGTPAASSPSGAGATSGGGSVAGTVNFFSWQGYDLLDIPAMKAWRQKNDVQVKSTYISNHNDITAKFTTGGGKGIYNLSTYEAGYGPFYVGLNIPSPLDMSRIPNFRKTYPIFQSGPIASKWWNFGGHQWCLPFTWGLQGVNYDASKIAAPTSYRELLQPQFKGRIGVTDDIVAAIVIGAHVLGIFRQDSLYTPSQLNQIIGFWQEMKANARLIIPSYGNMADLFVAGEIVAATPGWAAVNSFAAAKGDDKVKHALPKEGSATFCDGYMIPQGAADLDPVYGFINEAFSPEAQAQEAANLVQACVTPDALDLMSADVRALYPYGQIDQVLTASAPLEAIPAKVPSGYASFTDWNNAWEAFKAS